MPEGNRPFRLAAQVATAAGPRFEQLELDCLIGFAVVTDDGAGT